MADVKLNPVLESVRGKIGDLVFKRVNGSMIISRKPDTTNRILSDAQKAVLEQFRQAAVYGRTALADQTLRAAYAMAAKERKKPIFSLMVADFFHPPEVNMVDVSAYTGQAGSTIGIRADDDFKIIGVDVTITDTAGSPIEHGAAVKSATDPTLWVYTATASVLSGTPLRVEVSATDRPGHKSTKIANA